MRRIIAAGDDACLVELGGVAPSGLRAARAAAERCEGVLAVITGHSSLLVIFDPPMFDMEPLVDAISTARSDAAGPPSTHHDIDVCFADEYAPDLERVLDTLKLDRDDFVNELTSCRLSARYLGFKPGFAYMEGLPGGWPELPRLDTSRQRVAAGSVGLAGAMAGIYPNESPGGWNIIGSTHRCLWRPDAAQPNLIAPGDTVMLWPVDELVPAERVATFEIEGEPFATVLDPGQQTLVVPEPDLSRLAAGLPVGGSFDPIAAATAARLAGGNGSSVLECVLVGPHIEMLGDRTCAWHGAAADITVNGRRAKSEVLKLRSGDRIRIGRIHEGFRGYLAFDRSIAGNGSNFPAPRALRKNEQLRIDAEAPRLHIPSTRITGDLHELVVFAGPHEAPRELLEAIESRPWKVSPASDRVGVRISPPATTDAVAASKLLSCGVRCGTVQWHPNGDLILMGADHPVTGGYPQPVTVARQDRWKIAHLAPGDEVRFRVSPAPFTPRELL